jgi:WD40 repeat protein
MELFDVYLGHNSWQDYLTNRALTDLFEKTLEQRTEGFEKPLPSSPAGGMRVDLTRKDYRTALDSGLGAIGGRLERDAAEADCSIEINFENLAAGIDHLNADFNLLLGDCIWKLQMHQGALNDILQEIRLAEFEREARAYRNRAERAYLNGWYEEALSDFFEAEKRNYPDFAIHRSIASISLYHLLDLPRAHEYFAKAARYARPTDLRQSAEAHYFAGMAAAVQHNTRLALEHLAEAVALNPELYEAHYQMSCLAAVMGDGPVALAHLEPAIKGDPRYYERAKEDRSFDSIRPEVKALADHLMKQVEEKLSEIKEDARLLEQYVIARPENQRRISTIFQSIEEQSSATNTYSAGLRFMETLAQAHLEIKSLHDLFFKQYQIDARDYVRSVAFSPDGRLIACGFLYEGIRVWEVDTALKVRSLKGHTSSVNSVSFSPNNDWLASASRDRTIRLWDVETGRELRTLRGHQGEVRAVTFSPDGEWLASASHDSTVRLWRAVTGREVEVFDGHTHGVTSVAFSPDGSLLASGSQDRTICLWETATGRHVKTLKGHTLGATSVAFSPDGRWLASGGEDKVVIIWDVATGERARTLSGHRNDVTSIAFSPDGELLAAGSLGQTIRIWKAATGRIIKTLWYREISWNQVAFSPKGQWLVLGSRDLQFWLKAVLTQEQYEKAKAGESHEELIRMEPELTALERAELAWKCEEEGDDFSPDEGKHARSQCRICGSKLTFLEKAFRKRYCISHR